VSDGDETADEDDADGVDVRNDADKDDGKSMSTAAAADNDDATAAAVSCDDINDDDTADLDLTLNFIALALTRSCCSTPFATSYTTSNHL
jgi:hypothetical protein